jgi:hypothetical protein
VSRRPGSTSNVLMLSTIALFLETKQVVVSIEVKYIKKNNCNKWERQRGAIGKNKSKRTMKKNKKEGYETMKMK